MLYEIFGNRWEELFKAIDSINESATFSNYVNTVWCLFNYFVFMLIIVLIFLLIWLGIPTIIYMLSYHICSRPIRKVWKLQNELEELSKSYKKMIKNIKKCTDDTILRQSYTAITRFFDINGIAYKWVPGTHPKSKLLKSLPKLRFKFNNMETYSKIPNKFKNREIEDLLNEYGTVDNIKDCCNTRSIALFVALIIIYILIAIPASIVIF